MSIRNQFERTICNCEACSRFCYSIPGMLGPGDVERLAEHLELPAGTVELQMLEASPGALVGIREPTGVRTFRIPTIVPRLIDGQCVFLEATGLCRVHPVAPFGCAYCDDHMDRREADRRSTAVLQEIMQDQEYLAAWSRISDVRGVGLSHEQKRRNDFARRRPAAV